MIKGKNTHRWAQNPLEQRFAEAWSQQQEFSYTLDYLLSDRVNERQPVSEETQVAVATVIQWLGSPVGQGFLEEVLGEEIGDRIRELSAELNKDL